MANRLTFDSIIVGAIMGGKGDRFNFHGSFTDKAKAVAKEKEVNGFIREHTIGGVTRYYVLTRKPK